jgi:hypothetical protein
LSVTPDAIEETFSLRRSLLLSFALALAAALAGCGGSSNNPNQGKLTKLQFRAFVANASQAALHIVDETKDQQFTTFDQTTGLVSAGNITITGSSGLSASPAYIVRTGNLTLAATQGSGSTGVSIIDNTQEQQTAEVALPAFADSLVVTSDSKTAYAAMSATGQVAVIDIATAAVTANLSIGGVNALVIAPDNSKVLAFSIDQPTVNVIKTSDNTVTQITGLTSPVGGVISSDNTKAYIFNCGPECGAVTPASVSQVDLTASPATVTTTVPVEGATVGFLDSSGNLFVAGSPGSGAGTGRLDVITVANMTVAKSGISISDGFHTLMVAGPTGKLYIGARNCTFTSTQTAATACLSIFDPSNGNTVVNANIPPALSTNGVVTAVTPVTAKDRNVIYAAIGGQFVILDGATDQPTANQIDFAGTIVDVKSAQ